ncbi:putative Protein kinase domain containing protein [Blattamonas nauphoetae]|uniref:Protein kinase domain-containing protein n=1 Tax=Blattamonas nauphoetae TaxID=2049346 RepID=A0ABQ9XKQ3_9EUKA|nr:putative Protein kinase domain containing protein [Blattamonas nauphoetae]
MSTYRKGAMIGRGSLGTVMRLHNDQTKEEVVMKHVKQTGTNSASSLESTLQRLVSLRSETLLPYLSYDRHDDGFDVFMSFWDKKTLGKHVERQEKNGVKLTEGQIYGFLSQIVPGLLVLHEHGIVHGLLKPSNVLVVSQTRCLLCDYGLAEFIPRSKLVQSPYSAPELRHGAPYATLEKVSKGMDSEKGLSEIWKNLRWIGNTYSQGLWKTVKTMLHPDSSQRPSLDSLPLLSRINTASKGALDRSLTRHLSHSPLSTPQATDRAPKIEEITHPSPILVDSEKIDDDSEDRGLDQNEVLRFAAAPVPTSPELMLRNTPPTFHPNQLWSSSLRKRKHLALLSAGVVKEGQRREGRVDEMGKGVFGTSQTRFQQPNHHRLPFQRRLLAERSEWDGRGRGRGGSGEGGRREKEGWMDSSGLSEAMRMEVMEMIAASVGGQGRRGGEEESEEKEGRRRKVSDTRTQERELENEQTMGVRGHKEQDRSEEMEFPQSEDVNVAAVSSLLSSLSSLSLSMKTTKAAMAAELGGFSAFVREWEATGRDLGNEADNTQLEALMGVLQEEMRKTEELADIVADAEYSKTLSFRLSSLEEQNRSLDVSLSSLASSLCSPTLHSLTKTNIDLRQEWVHAMEEMRMAKGEDD